MGHKIVIPSAELLNEFVSRNKFATIFQTGYILDIYENVPNCEPFALAAVNDDDEILSTLVGVTFIEKDGIFSKLSSHSTIRGGPILIDNEQGKCSVSNLINEYNKIKKNKEVYNRIYPFFKSNCYTILQQCGYKFEEELNFLIDLNRPEEDIWHSIHKDKRKNIKRAEKNNVIIKEVENEDELIQFYELIKETSKIAKIPIKDFKLFRNIYDKLVTKNLAKIFIASFNKEYIAGRLILTYQGTIYDWYAGSKQKYLYLYPNDYLVWHILSWGVNNGYFIFDFGGAGSPHVEYGVREFKRRFGGELVNYGFWTKIHSPTKYRVAEKAFKIYRKLFY